MAKYEKSMKKVQFGYPAEVRKKYDPQIRKVQSTKKVRFKYDIGGLRLPNRTFCVFLSYFVLFEFGGHTFFVLLPDAQIVLFSYFFRTLPFLEKVLI